MQSLKNGEHPNFNHQNLPFGFINSKHSIHWLKLDFSSGLKLKQTQQPLSR